MKIKKQSWLPMTFIVLFVVSSCKKSNNDVVAKADLSTSIAVKEGMLKFKSQEQLDATIANLRKISLKDAEAQINQLQIKSLALDTVGGKLPVVNVIDPIFSRLLNNNASLIVGDKIFLLKDNNEYLISNENFDLYRKVLAQDNYFENNDKIYSKDVSANYKATEILGVAKVTRSNIKVNSIEGDGNVTTSGEVTYVDGAFSGIRYHYSQEFYTAGRPERVYMAITGQPTIINTSYNMIMKGEDFRRGGAFGGKQWRESAIAWGRIYRVVSNFGSPAEANLQGPGTDTNFAYAFNLPYKESLSLGWQYKKGYDDPTQTFTHIIAIR